MTTINEMYNRWRKLQLRKQVPIIIEQTKENIIALNQRQLYNRSEDSEGNPLRFYSSNSYAFEKEQKNPLPGFGRPDLYDTGSFYRQFVVRVSPTFYEITSKDSKTNKLTKKYGKDVFGLQKESKAEYVNDTLFVGIKRYVEHKTGLQFH